MKRLFHGTAALAIATIFATPALAQQSGGSLGGSLNVPRLPPTPTPTHVPERGPPTGTASIARYLNSGDTVTAQHVQALLDQYMTARSNITSTINDPNADTTFADASRSGNQSEMQAAENARRALAGGASSDGDTVNAAYQRILAQRETRSIGSSSRPVSNLERQQTQIIDQYSALVEARLTVAQGIQQRATDARDPALAREAGEIVRVLNSLRGSVRDAQDFTERYDGRSFTNDRDAYAYLESRDLSSSITFANSLRIEDQLSALQSRLTRETSGINASFPESDLNEANRVRGRALAERSYDLHSPAINVAEIERQAQRYGDPPVRNGRQPPATGSASAAPVSGAASGTTSGRRSATPAADHAVDAAPEPRAPSAEGTTAVATAAATSRYGLGRALDAIDAPAPVPTRPDYPTVSAAERARIAQVAADRRAAQQAVAAAASAAERAAAAAAAQQAAERAAMVERARVNDENHRLLLAAQRLAQQDARWAQLVRDRFGNGAWDAFANGATVTTLQLLDIYRNYDPNRAIPPASSLSSAGNSLSSAGNSLSLAGLDYRDPAVESLNEVLYQLTTRHRSPFDSYDRGDPARAAQQAYNAGSFDIRYNRDGREGLESGGYLAASLFSFEDPYLRELTANGLGGIDQALAQPFNVVLTWGAGAYDLDLHMTGPLGADTTGRFHIYYAATGALDAQPFAALIKDCICRSGSEVILTSALNRGGVYRVSVFNFGDQSATSTNLANASGAQLQIVRGGTTQTVGDGTTIVGGRTLLTVTVPVGQASNTWVAAELDPANGRITVPGAIRQSASDREVQ